MKTTNFIYTTEQIQKKSFDDVTCKRLCYIEMTNEQKDIINAYPCEIKEAPNGFTAIFIDGFAEIFNPDFGSFFAKTEDGIAKIRKYVETGEEFEIVGDEVK